MNAKRTTRILTTTCLLALVALALMVWSLFDPRPIPVVVALSVGQGLGTLSFVAFLVVAASDLRARLARAPSSKDVGAP